MTGDEPHASSSLIDIIYDAAVEPARWTEFLDMFAASYPGGRGVMFHVDTANPQACWAAAANWDPAWTLAYDAYYGRRNPWLPGIARRNVGLAVAAEAMLSEADLRRTEFFHDFLAPQELGTGVGVTLLKDGSRLMAASVLFQRRSETATPHQVRRLARLAPHLARAARIQRRLSGLELARRTAEAALDRLAAGIVVTDAQARVLFVNAAAQRIIDKADGLAIGRGGALAAVQRSEEAQLHQLIRRTTAPDSHGGGALAVRRRSEKRPFGLLVAPLRLLSDGLGLERATAVVFISDPEEGHPPPTTILRTLYGLTSAEARVAAAIVEGETAETIAERHAISEGTVRQHLKSILAKTETHRQSELVRLVLRGPAGLHAAGEARAATRRN